MSKNRGKTYKIEHYWYNNFPVSESLNVFAILSYDAFIEGYHLHKEILD